MALNEYEKEAALQQALVEDRLDQCDETDLQICRTLTQDAARIANEYLQCYRFGSFCGNGCCIVYANMGANNSSTRERFRRIIQQAGVTELAVAVWPLAQSDNAHYTWAVMILDFDGDKWADVARKAWVAESGS
jgi:hypothetical protein